MSLGLTAQDPRAKAAQPLEGVTEWQNPRNGVHVVEIHYRANPAFRSPEWKREQSAGMSPSGWQREYEIAWEIPDGEPVFPLYQPGWHRRDVPTNPDARLLRFWDFGHVCPVTLFAQLDLFGRLIIVGELVILGGTSLEQHIESTKARSLELMGRPTDCFDAGDPAAEKEMELGQVKRVLLNRGIVLHCQPSNQGSYAALNTRLGRTVRIPDGHPEAGISPAFIVTPRAPVLHGALAGGFHRNPATGKPVDVHPDKDVCDALRYGNDNLLGQQSTFWRDLQRIAKADCAW